MNSSLITTIMMLLIVGVCYFSGFRHQKLRKNGAMSNVNLKYDTDFDEEILAASKGSNVGVVCAVVAFFLVLIGAFCVYEIKLEMDYYYPYHEIDAFVTVLVCVIICAILTLFAYLWYSKMSITVTDKRIYGSVAFGKRVDLPIDSISAVGISMFQGIAIGTSSGRIVFSMIKNRDEIHTVISNLLIQRQNQSQKTITTITQEIPLSNADEIKKYKDLLDSGVITQEEFDAKKKQLLGL